MMKLQATLIYFSIFAGCFLSFAPKTSAQDNEYFSALSQETLNRLNGDCRGTTEVSYRSQALTSPDDRSSVYIDMTLRRRGRANSYGEDTFVIRCNGNIAERPSGELIVEKEGKVIRKRLYNILGITRNIYNYTVVNPIAFSADSRYLVLRVDVSDGQNASWVNHVVLDTFNDYQLLSFAACEQFKGNNFIGFLSNLQVVFACEKPGEIGPIEVVNLQTRELQRLNQGYVNKLTEARSYGTVATEFSVVQEQQFPVRY